MPFHKKVRGSWFMVHRFKKVTTNYEQSTTNRKSAGFTLIEILVVIAIIATLAGFVFVSFTNAKEKSLDRRRKTDVQALKQALLSAKLDDGFYKNSLSDVAPKYIAKIPQDPELRIDYIYLPQPTTPPPDCKTTSTCTSFSLIACLDNPNDKEQDTPTKNIDCPIASYTATSPQ